ncbi:MAG: hypothetical protein GVY06_03620 [Alphaproteobacteria bacterium]|jgi:3-hydroxyacyl-CoA dehydrogenase|nr:hypothetical protein [Alphaproteobacteria bacterium]
MSEAVSFTPDEVGARAVMTTMERLGAGDDRFAPAETLKRLAADSGRFTEVPAGG